MASLSRRVRRAGLARRLDAVTRAARDKVRHRESVRENAAALASIGAALAAAGIDPAGNAGLRYFAGADRALAALGDSEALRRADAAFIAQEPILMARQSLAAQAAERAAGLAGRPPPGSGSPLASGSPLDWYAWSLAADSR